jgi:hypothetical protein
MFISLPPRSDSRRDHKPGSFAQLAIRFRNHLRRYKFRMCRNDLLRWRFLYRAVLIHSRVSGYRTPFECEIFHQIRVRCQVHMKQRVWISKIPSRCPSISPATAASETFGGEYRRTFFPSATPLSSTSSFLPGIPENDPQLPSQFSLWRADRGNLRLPFLPGSECSCVSRCPRAVVSGAVRLHVAGLVARAE